MVRDVATVAELLSDRYELLECVGSGGMGMVHRAHDQQLDRDVAVKLPTLMGSRTTRERFRREARAAARLNHPNVVRVYDWDDRDGIAFLVMEFVDGQSLREVLNERGRLGAVEAASIGEQIAEALAHAHAKGVVHRDVKPGNVLLEADGSVKVTDFGIARATDSDTITDPGAVFGTVGYLAPEQLHGGHVDGRSDLYSLGMLLATVTGGVRSALDPVIRRATAPSPEDRYQRAEELRDALRAVVRSETVTAIPVVVPPPRRVAPPAPPARTTRETSRVRRVWRLRHLLAVLLPIVIVAGGVGAFVVVTDHPPTAPVPEVVNRDVFSAIAALRDAKFEVVQRFVDDPTPGGTVLDQRPGSGRDAEEGSRVVITVSRVQAMVPRVPGLMLDAAKTRLQTVGFVNVTIREEDHDDELPGTVLRSEPVQGLRSDKTAEVVLVVARDPYVQVPVEVVGADEGTATATLQGLGLQVHKETQTSRLVATGIVMSVSPGVGTEIRRGSTMTIRVSAGPRQIPVPNTVSRSHDDAVDELEDEGFNVAVVFAPGSSSQRGRVISQTPQGVSAPEGSRVTITVGITAR